MSQNRARHSAEFKAKVALAALAETKTLSEISSEFNVHSTQVTRWKQELIGNAADFFGKGKKKTVNKRCQLLALPRASFYRGLALGLRSGDLELMRKIDELYLEHPWMGSRTLSTMLTTLDQPVGRDRVRRLCGSWALNPWRPNPALAGGTPGIRSTLTC